MASLEEKLIPASPPPMYNSLIFQDGRCPPNTVVNPPGCQTSCPPFPLSNFSVPPNHQFGPDTGVHPSECQEACTSTSQCNHSYPRYVPDICTTEGAYCTSLAKSLYYANTPLTVGFYAPWGRCTDKLLNIVKVFLLDYAKKKANKELRGSVLKPRQNTGKDLIKLILLMMFYHPNIKDNEEQQNNIDFHFIRFSAWEFEGSNNLWAGLVTTLCDSIEKNFGLLPFSIFRAVNRKTIILRERFLPEWVSKKYLCLPLWFATLLVMLIGIVVGAIFLGYGFPLGDPMGNILSVVEGAMATIVGIAAAGAMRIAAVSARNAVITQKGKVQKIINRTDMSSQLGFMSNVKWEVNIITRYLQVLEVFRRQKIRIVLEITNLDKCMPDKVVGVLNAMNILLSDPKSPFISILAVDPSIIVECVQHSIQLKGMADNGYQYLNRIITLPFCIPKMDATTKLSQLTEVIKQNSTLIKDMEEDAPELIRVTDEKDQIISQQDSPYNNYNGVHRNYNMARRHSKPAIKLLIDKALKHLQDEEDYINGSDIHIKRLVNTIIITIRLISYEPHNKIDPEKVAKWVILTSQWPCRLSWILQCIEDEQQRRRLHGHDPSAPCDTPLNEVFEKSLQELGSYKTHIKDFLELDWDPEIFDMLCPQVTVADATFFLPYTVNLDQSIKRKMELLRGSNNMCESKKTNRLTALSLSDMNVDDVCKEIGKLEFQEDSFKLYQEKIKEHKLNGKELLKIMNDDLRKLLHMNNNVDWRLFSLYFLGILPPTCGAPTSASMSTRQSITKPGLDLPQTYLK